MIEFPFVIHNNKKSKNGLYSFYSTKKPEPTATPIPALSPTTPVPAQQEIISNKNALLTEETNDFISKISDQESECVSKTQKFNIETETNPTVDRFRFFMKKKESFPKYKLEKVQDNESERVQYKLVKEETTTNETLNDESDVSAVPGEINDKQQPPHKYRLEKYQDSDGELKFKLQKVQGAQQPQQPQPQQNNVKVVQNKKRYKLDKFINDDGIIKYTLKEYDNEILDEIPPSSQSYQDEIEESISVEKFQQFQSFQNMIYSNKVEIHSFPLGKESSFLIGDGRLFGQKSFCAQKVIENSYYLNNSNFLDSINIKLLSQNLNQKTELSLGLYILEVNSTTFTKIQQISLGEFEQNMGKVSTKTLEFKTPKKGCFLVSILDVKTLENKKLEGSLLIDYNIYITKQRMNKDREITLCKMNETLSIH